MTTANDSINDSANAAPIAASPDWRQAVIDLLNFWIPMGRCFSSGEIASALRVHRPDFRFSVPRLGEYVRDLFYGLSLPQYPDTMVDDGLGGQIPTPTPVTMSPRYTVGLYPDRTPAGVQVFVYGPSPEACDAHEFEVFIPDLSKGETMADAPATATPVPQPARGSTKGSVFIGGSKTSADDKTANVAADGRIYVPRAAFEAAVHMGGTPLRGGDPVYVTQTATEAVITLEDVPGAKAYDLWRDRGKIAFASQDASKPFPAGKAYGMTITAGKIVIPLT